jgi:hypothetical protein
VVVLSFIVGTNFLVAGSKIITVSCSGFCDAEVSIGGSDDKARGVELPLAAAAAWIRAIFCESASPLRLTLPALLLSGPVPLGAACPLCGTVGDAGGEFVGEAIGREKFRLRVLSLRSNSSATSDKRLELRCEPGGLVGGG